MTTAARPTFDPARGGGGRGEKDLSALSKQYSSRDLPGHTKLKYRETGQSTAEELRNRDFRKELEERERDPSRSGKHVTSVVRKAIEAGNSTTSSSSKKSKIDSGVTAAHIDADDAIDNDTTDSESDDDEEDDTAALLAELNRIKQERLQETARKEHEKKQEEERIRMENILSGNPLINYAPGATVAANNKDTGVIKVKRRWDDDVVFKNCARSEPQKKLTFINDSLRSEFHKKFMEKYIK